jgi:hypothetical protein
MGNYHSFVGLDIPVMLTPLSGDVDPPQGLWFKELE